MAPTLRAPRHAIVCHGAGSSGAVARMLMPPPTLGADVATYPEDRSGDVEAVMRALDAWDAAVPDGAERVVAGISLGAHAAARWCAQRARGETLTVILALPAWTGVPGPAAQATLNSAQQIRDRGIATSLETLRAAEHGDRALIVELLDLAWSAYDDDALAAALERAAAGAGPSRDELASLRGRAVVAWWDDDPFHPREVGLQWARDIPRARGARIPWGDMTRSPACLGRITGRLAGLA